jgi:hypothetical protein
LVGPELLQKSCSFHFHWVRFPRKAKNSTSEGGGEDREVAVGTT